MKKRLLTFGVAGLLMVLVASICVAEPEFSVTGHFRARSYWITNPDLVKGGPERSYTDQRLILNPVLKLSDAIQIKMRIRALDYIWGHNTVPGLTWPEMMGWTGAAASNQGELGTNNFQWDRAWAHIFFGKYGSLQIGRQQTDLFHNFSIAEDDTYPRYHYISPVFALQKENNIMFGMLYDKRTEGDPDVGGAADSFAWCPWVFFWNPNLTIGYVFFVWDWAGVGPAGESSNWIMHDAMINAKIGPLDIKSEWDYDMGKWIGSWLDHERSFEFFVDVGYPIEPAKVINRASILVALFSGAGPPKAGVWQGALGSNEDWVEEWKIDLILWDQLYNVIGNAWVFRPKIDFVVPNTKLGGFVSACLSLADQEAQYNAAPPGIALTTGDEKTIGTELDLGINYTLGPRQTIEAVVGLFMPGKYFDEANRDTTFGAALKTHIRF